MVDIYNFPFINLNDHEFRSLYHTEILPFVEYENKYFVPVSNSCAHDQNFDPDLNLLDIHIPSKYYDLCDYSNQYDDIIIAHINIRSMCKNIDDFLYDISNLNHSILTFSETWLSDSSQHLYDIPNFNAFHKNRENKRGGGVAIYVSDKYLCSSISELSCSLPFIESVFVLAEIGNAQCIIGNIYRPPSSDIREFLTHMYDIMDILISKYINCKLLITGDFNIDLLKIQKSQDMLEYYLLMTSYGFLPYILRPTRVTGFSATLIDHIWFNDNSCVRSSGIILSGATDHFPIYINLNFQPIQNDNIYVFHYKRINNIRNNNLFKTLISDYDWSAIFEESCVESLYNTFHSKLSEIYNECFPLLQRKRKKLDVVKPYITSEIKSLIKEKHKLQRKYFKRPITYRDQYVYIRNKVSKLTATAKSEYYRNEIESNMKDTRKLWSILKDITGIKRKSTYIKEIHCDDGIMRGGEQICEVMNKYFSNIGNHLASSFDHAGNSNHDPLNYLSDVTAPSFTFSEISLYDMGILIQGLNCSVSTTKYDIIPISIYKNYFNILGPYITKICNMSITSGVYPSRLKTAKLICIHKGGDHKTISNYRPISILPAFGKIIEKVVSTQISEHFALNNLFTNSQFGFRKGISTEDGVSTVIHSISQFRSK